MRSNTAIRDFILSNVKKFPQSVVKQAMNHFGVSRTTVIRHVNKLIVDKKLIQIGSTKNVQYFLPDAEKQMYQFNINPSLDEFEIYQDIFSKYITKIDKNLEDILSYVITEIINNTKDHSQGKVLSIEWLRQARSQHITINDDGIGIYNKLAGLFKVDDLREIVLHLSKGKVTTNPANHTGEGIFFSSRAVDSFKLSANGIVYEKNNKEQDWFVTSTNSPKLGTSVEIIIENHPQQQLKSIFQAFQKNDSLSFNVTEIKVELSKLGTEKYISRSQAKRIIIGLEKFDVIILDFSNIRMAGQGFVHEIFRIFKTNGLLRQLII